MEETKLQAFLSKQKKKVEILPRLENGILEGEEEDEEDSSFDDGGGGFERKKMETLEFS